MSESATSVEPKSSARRNFLERRAQPLPRRAQMSLTILTLVVLVVATVWAWRSAHLSFSTIDWLPIAIAFAVGAPATLVLKMLEYDAAARLIGSRAGPRRALEVAVISSAANLLPLPGSLIVTTRSLSEQGATYGSAAVASSIPGLAWLGLTAVIGGVSIMIAGSWPIGLAVAAAGIACLAVTGAMFRRTAPLDGRPQLALRIVLIETSWVGLSGFRLWLVLHAIGMAGTPAQVLALAVAGAMSVAIGFFPGGLGVREALIALLSPIINLPLSEGVVLGVIDRVVWITFLSLAALVLVATRARAVAGEPSTTP
ncbi:MAG: hypothetical protein QOG65_3600 [Actinomycetota bacterium]|nr:hypothetical protein [Actinomycetota bacterium]MDQ1386221.1 hypothetical protein [Actinomycetota bacterium]